MIYCNIVFQNLVFNNLRCDKITLFTDTLTHSQCESLEEILKRLQFNHIYFEGSGFTAEIAYPLFQMFEYYESALHVDINFGYSHIGIKGAEAVAKYLQEVIYVYVFIIVHHRKLVSIISYQYKVEPYITVI